MDGLLKADIVFARLLLMSFFVPEHLQVYLVFASSIYFVYRTLSIKYKPLRSDILWALLLGGSYLLLLIAIPMTPAANRGFVLKLCERRVAFFLLPIVFAIMAPAYRQVIKSQLMYFVYGCLIACSLANLDFLYHHYILDRGMNSFSHVYYRIIYERFTGIHPTYMSIYLGMSVCIALTIPGNLSRRWQMVNKGIIYILLTFMLALFAKSPLLAMIAIGVHYVYLRRKELYRFKGAFAGLAALLAGAYFFIPFFRQRIGELSGIFGSGTEENITQNSVSIRKLIWTTDTNMLRHYWLTGTGPGRLLDLLHQRYFFQSIYRGYWVGYFDPHNQYFYDWLSFGIAGIVFLVVVLYVQFRRAILSGNHLYLYLLILIATTFFTETLLARQHGVVFYAVFCSLLFFSSGKPKTEALL